MSKNYDLHTHSLASDGTLTPAALVARARAAGVEVLALTDHDDVGGIAEARAAAAGQGIELVPGIELSVTWAKLTVHVVGLHIDPQDPTLCAGLARLSEFRQWRAEEMGRRLAKHGIEGAYEGARELAQGRIVSRTHFARFLLARGFCSDVNDVFRHFLKPNRPGHVPGQWAALDEAVGWIRGAGGIAVLAHPARYDLSATKRRRLFGEFVQCGGEALEVVSGSHTRDDCQEMARYAQRFGLLASAGSDFHDPDNPWIAMGHLPPLPEGCLPVWEGARWPGNTDARLSAAAP